MTHYNEKRRLFMTTAENVDTESLEEATRVAVLELLLSPEYGDDWLEEGIRMEKESSHAIGDSEVEVFGGMITAQLRTLAEPIFIALTSSRNRETYSKFFQEG